jgi:hypothetical protein
VRRILPFPAFSDLSRFLVSLRGVIVQIGRHCPIDAHMPPFLPRIIFGANVALGTVQPMISSQWLQRDAGRRRLSQSRVAPAEVAKLHACVSAAWQHEPAF